MVVFDSICNFERDGFAYRTMSESWREMCRDMPCSPRVVVRGFYATAWIDLPDENLVIQAWKGNCPHLPGLPGGIGGEVGVYRREPTRTIRGPRVIPDLCAFPRWQRPLIRRAARWLIRRGEQVFDADIEDWWPRPTTEVIAMSLSCDGHAFFDAQQTGGYWLSQWMTYTSYVRFAALKRHVPDDPRDFEMRFSVGDRHFVWRDKIEAIGPTTRAR
jgi:hypothetical protein